MTENSFPKILPFVFIISLIAIIFELIWNFKKHKHVYNLKETLANFSIFMGMQVSRYFTFGWQIFWIGMIYEFAPIKLEINLLTIILAFFLVDFGYYWQHRAMHEIKALWAFHLVHHSSPWLNFTTSFRLNWLSPLIGPIFITPVVLLGFDPILIVSMFGINLFYQFWLHTESIGKLGIVEGILNTPSAHRVHHGSNSKYIDKNYGGVLMIWDRIFGTYQKEEEAVVYGTTLGFVGHNPFKLIFHGFIDYFKGILNLQKVTIVTPKLIHHHAMKK